MTRDTDDLRRRPATGPLLLGVLLGIAAGAVVALAVIDLRNGDLDRGAMRPTGLDSRTEIATWLDYTLPLIAGGLGVLAGLLSLFALPSRGRFAARLSTLLALLVVVVVAGSTALTFRSYPDLSVREQYLDTDSGPLPGDHRLYAVWCVLLAVLALVYVLTRLFVRRPAPPAHVAEVDADADNDAPNDDSEDRWSEGTQVLDRTEHDRTELDRTDDHAIDEALGDEPPATRAYESTPSTRAFAQLRGTYYVLVDGTDYGPYGADEIAEFADQGRILPSTLIRPTDGYYEPAERAPGLFHG